MSNIDKQAVQAVADLKAGYTLGHADVAILNELARIALASLEVEPVAWLLSGGGAKNNVSFDSGNAYADPLREVTPLYAAPQLPQPAVPETVPESLKDKLLTICDLVEDNDEYCQDIWNACRAAMLQAGNHTEQHLDMVNSPVIPDGWVACSEQMPEDEQEVIVQNKMGYRYVSYFDEHSGLFFDMRGGNQMNCIEHIFVTHWMPLPAAPQQEVK